MNNLSKFHEKINGWCNALELKAKNQSFGEKQKIYFWFKENKKYYKIFSVVDGDEKTHAFLDKNTGDIYRPLSQFYPNKNKIFNLFDDYEILIEKCDWAGVYLGKKIKKKLNTLYGKNFSSN